MFGRWLGEVTGVAVEFFDERFTSVEAESFLLDAGMTRKRRKQRRDMLAAQIMLTAYLESNPKARSLPARWTTGDERQTRGRRRIPWLPRGSALARGRPARGCDHAIRRAGRGTPPPRD